MSWLKVDDGFSAHPKLVELSRAERWTWVELLCYCSRYRTDGLLPKRIKEVVPYATPSYLKRCVDLGLVDDTEDGMKIHDFRIYNAATVEEKVAAFMERNPTASANEAHKAIGGKRELVLAEHARYLAGTHVVPESVPEILESVPDGGTPPLARALPVPSRPSENLGANAPAPIPSIDVQRVYDHWREARGKTRANYERMSDGRRKKIQARLREFSVDDLCRAIDGIAHDPWPDRAMQDDITIVFRSTEQVDKFLELAATGGNVAGAQTHNEFQAYMRHKLKVVNDG